MRYGLMLLLGSLLVGWTWTAFCADLVLPQNRGAFYSRERIELAVIGLEEGQNATVELRDAAGTLAPVQLQATGDGSTVTLILPPHSLAGGDYDIHVDGEKRASISVRHGLPDTTLNVGQTGPGRKAGGTFNVSNAFSFGLPDGDGPRIDVRNRKSRMFVHYENSIKDNMPDLIYMYWTGYVLHKPWGASKSWATPDMVKMMRMFNLHVAQRLRRYRENFISIGCIDEPGLPWGKTPAGGWASGIPLWNEAEWYGERGWEYTNDPASRPDADWLKYMDVRRKIMKENFIWAKEDIETVWPDAVFATDVYAPHAAGDGTDAMNQEMNDIPTTHVFADYHIGKLGVMSGLYVEKSHDPTSKVAHAMNGQLFGKRVPLPQTKTAYHLMLNALVAGGMDSNWWLNWRPMTEEALAEVNEPKARIGPALHNMEVAGHDVAVLWSFTELAMRCKDITAREAKTQSGEQVKLMVADLPEIDGEAKKELDVNLYSVGTNYKGEVMDTHHGLVRAGYNAHIIHEDLVPRGILEHYKVLVVPAQTYPFPEAVRQGIQAFADAGGAIVVDRKTSVDLPGAVVCETGLSDIGYRKSFPASFGKYETPKHGTVKKSSYFDTNYHRDTYPRAASHPLKKTMAETPADPIAASDGDWLGFARHQGGEGFVYMVLNAHQVLPEIPDDQAHWIYNYAPYEATFTLQDLPDGAVAYSVEGNDWKTSKAIDPTQPIEAAFEPGEMKLYFVAPRAPEGLAVSLQQDGGVLQAEVMLRNVKMPWPLEVTFAGPDGAVLLHLYRATGTDGTWKADLPVGTNAPAGEYTLSVKSLPGGFAAEAKAAFTPAAATAEPLAATARTFDEAAIRAFLGQRPNLVVPYSNDTTKAAAETLVEALTARGVTARAAEEASVWHKATYPRVWDPYIKVYVPTGEPKPAPVYKDKEGNELQEEIKRELTIESADDGTVVVKTADGEPLEGKWNEPGTLLTVVGKGWAHMGGKWEFYEPGCQILVDHRRRHTVLDGRAEERKATEAERAKWRRPWTALRSYVGAVVLVPQLPEAYQCDEHLVLLGGSQDGTLVAALQASELLPQTVDPAYPGPGKALVQFAWSPFELEKNVIHIGATDAEGLQAGIDALLKLAPMAE